MSKEQKKSASQKKIDLMPKDKKTLSILQARTRLLAKLKVDNFSLDNQPNYIRFKIGTNSYYGIPYEYIVEIIPAMLSTKLPNAPDFLTGVINRHGVFIAVVDLKRFFHMQLSEYNKNTHIIIIQNKNMMIGILADNIDSNDSYNPAMLKEPMPSLEGSGIKTEYIQGLHNEIVAILNIEKLISNIQLQLIEPK